MSHETHHHADTKPGSSYGAAFWFVIILVGLFIGAVNFVNVMGHDEGGDHGATHEPKTEATSGATGHDDAHGAADSTHTGGH